jgi:hypothetical protein
MAFDRTKPVNGTTVDADLLRNNMNDLDDRIEAIVPVPGPPGPQGDPGPQGPPMSFPIAGPGIIQGRVLASNGDLAAVNSDPNGSGETSISIESDASSGAPILRITSRLTGGTNYSHRLDLAGIVDGAGSPSAQHGAILKFDGASALWRPVNGATEDVEVKDPADNISILHFVDGLYTGRTPVP